MIARPLMNLLVKWNAKKIKGDDVCYELTQVYSKEFRKAWQQYVNYNKIPSKYVNHFCRGSKSFRGICEECEKGKKPKSVRNIGGQSK